ncbi:efflux RND transporter periplasmic adaptor subunit [Phytopseudomonas dryadis]|uniref:EmrA/EmrK family multidrug efflux transporter periplasmic adaptor subunit n=1 Tax=Phytopseudomonas dryadis TaxID=2487520 RepID=A0A4Q9QYC4_9GAMM|nr:MULTISPECIES: efflux RND transporter periplasmic adaptor subunit [Pseudomonas]TBU88788.1 EmrA/EmrK family multidrug efflux transporter periplasmic adaptor subunit [Pseudomonas dryadis]TBV00666.1 EmrA/EmrK family multidrug efflux transporter periplasmic adaptor subunit [Pseudomonas dryadis]TBV13140.1 EmrA/EmrK family multidrug efflux transporter periplasmic adaptor subunit [Pseudomonas sp. FRB 230]
MTESQATPAAPNPGKRKRLLLGLGALVLLCVVAVFAYHELYGRFYQETDDAYVNGNLVQITPQITGTVTRIAVDDGDYVEAGQPLVWLDPADTEVAQQSAEANLAKTVRQVRGLFSNVDSYKAQVASRKIDVQRARADYQRRVTLARNGAISREELAHAQDTLSSAESALISAQQQLDTNQALIDDTVVASHPDVKSAAAQLRQAFLNHARSTLVAPVSGYVARRSVQLGSRVQPGSALMAVVPLHEIWIDANFKETQLRDMRIGQPVTVEADLYGDEVTYRGHVESLGVGTGSAFSLLPAQNASGNWIKIVQRLPVRIRLDEEALERHPLRIGLSTAVTVDLHDQSGVQLAERTPAEARFATAVYDAPLVEANALIERIIHANGPAQVGAARG